MSRLGQVTGFYGKLPSHGDFLSRRLPRQFIEPWDQWLQGGLASSREQLGKDWLNTFLFSPIWQFALAPGLCGEDAWAGVVMPSVDKVGRYFPLTLAAKVEHGLLTGLFEPGCGWFDALSQLALSTLEYDFDLQAFDEQLESTRLADFLVVEASVSGERAMPSGSARLAFHFQLDDEQDATQAFSELGDKLAGRFLAHCSYWRSAATEDDKPVLLLCESMPPIDAYIGFLNGEWPQRGWHFTSSRLIGSPYVGITEGSAGEATIISDPAIQLTTRPLPATSNEVPGETKRRMAAPLENSLEKHKQEWDSYGLSVVGLRRKLNEDAILDRADAGLWAVADGMGGHSAGDVASRALVNALAQIPRIDDIEHYSEQVASCLHSVNRDLLQMAENQGRGQIIGSTVVVLLIVGLQFRYLWAGDSRLYRYRQGVLEQLTTDHSLYNESISLGLPPLDGSAEQGRGNVITRAVGADTQLQLDFGQGQIGGQDIFILCSDGIDKELSHTEIAAMCEAGSACDIAHALVQQAENRGGRDNISVIVIKPL